jgi:hypothetical protein
MGTGGFAFAFTACPSLEESRLLPRMSITSWATLPYLWLEFERCVLCYVGLHHWTPCCHRLNAGIRAISFSSRGRSLRFLRDGVQSTRVTKGWLCLEGSELARDMSSVKGVVNGRVDLLRARDQGLGTCSTPRSHLSFICCLFRFKYRTNQLKSKWRPGRGHQRRGPCRTAACMSPSRSRIWRGCSMALRARRCPPGQVKSRITPRDTWSPLISPPRTLAYK